MPELSNLLRQRLASRAAAGARAETHPDAGALTAYSERLLPEDERAQILRHLAACSQCREVVILSLPAMDLVSRSAPSIFATARRWRFAWTPRLGFAALTVAVAVAAGLLIFSRKPALPPAPAQSAKQEPAAVPSAPAPTAPSLASNEPAANLKAPAEAAPSGGDIARKSENRKPSPLAANAVAKRPLVARNANPSLGRLKKASPDQAQVFDVRRNASAAVAEAAPLKPALTIAGLVNGNGRDYLNDKMFAGAAASQVLGGQDLAVEAAPQNNRSAALFSANNYAQLPVFSGLPATAGGAAHRRSFAPAVTHSFLGIVILGGREARQVFQKRPNLALSANMLNFSAMGGPGQLNPAREKNQSVEVAALPAPKTESELSQAHVFSSDGQPRSDMPTVGGVTTTSASPLAWKVEGGRLLKSSSSGSWVAAYPGGAGIEFSAVAASGVDVWAGGRDAALFHSHDSGATWNRIILGRSAGGAITAIRASSGKIYVKTSFGQSWSSADGGASWTPQD